MRRECRKRFLRHRQFAPPRISDPVMYHGTCVTHVPWCMPGSLTSWFDWNWWREKRSQHSRRMRNPQFNVSCKRPKKWNAVRRNFRLQFIQLQHAALKLLCTVSFRWVPYFVSYILTSVTINLRYLCGSLDTDKVSSHIFFARHNLFFNV